MKGPNPQNNYLTYKEEEVLTLPDPDCNICSSHTLRELDSTG